MHPFDELHARPCAEFPNDNSALHEGVVWMLLAPGGPLRAIRRAPTAPADVVRLPAPDPAPEVAAAPAEVLAPEPTVASPEPAAPEPAVASPEPVAPDARETAASVSAPRFSKLPVLVPPRPARRPTLVELKPRSLRPVKAAEPILAGITPAPQAEAITSAPEPEAIAPGLEPAAIAAAPEPAAVMLAPPNLDEPASIPPAELAAKPLLAPLHEPTPIPPAVLAAAPGPKDDVVVALFPAPLSTMALDDVRAASLGFTDDADSTMQETSLEEAPASFEIAAQLLELAEEPWDEARAESVPVVPEASAPAEAPPTPDAFDALVAAMVGVALASGSTRAAATLPKFLSDGRIDAHGIDGSVLERLARDQVAELSGSQLVATESLRTTAFAWRDVLRGQSEDFSACGATTLDEWASGLLATFGVVLSNGEIRRELRKKGVAAFGMRIAA